MESAKPCMLTVAEAAARLRRSPRTLYRWLAEDEHLLPTKKTFPGARKIKDGWLIPERDLDRLLSGPDGADEKPVPPGEPISKPPPPVRRSGFVGRW
jgi:hypothetical protein